MSGRFSNEKLIFPLSIDSSIFAEFMPYSAKNITANHNYEMWSDDTVHVVGTKELVEDPDLISFERECAQKAMDEDAAGAGFPDKRIEYAIRIDFLVALTFVLNLWDWSTLEVVTYLVKPSTEPWRCRFADHPVVKPFAGKADALMSHAWSNKWGLLIASAALGAPYGRYVWICAVANRQWAGNNGDIDFKSMVARSKAIIIANPIPDAKIHGNFSSQITREKHPKYWLDWQTADIEKLTYLFTVYRIWCVVELLEAMESKKPIIFRFLTVVTNSDGSITMSRRGADNLMFNLGLLVDVSKCRASNPHDTFERLCGSDDIATITQNLNRTTSSALFAAAAATQQDTSLLDAYVLGEPELLHAASMDQLGALLIGAASYNYHNAVDFILSKEPPTLSINKALLMACMCGNEGIGQTLIDKGADVNFEDKLLNEKDPNVSADPAFPPLLQAALYGHAELISLLIAYGARKDIVHKATKMDAFHCAAMHGHVRAIKCLFYDHGFNLETKNRFDKTPLHFSSQMGHVAATQLLLAAGADKNAVLNDKGSGIEHWTALHWAASNGHIEVVKTLIAAGVDASMLDKRGRTAYQVAQQCDKQVCADFLIAHTASLRSTQEVDN